MSVADFSTLARKLISPSQIVSFIKASSIGTGTHLNSCWTDSGMPAAGSIPTTTGATCDRTTAGALGQVNKLGGEQRAWLRRFAAEVNSLNGGMFMLCDRLAHVGGLSGTVTTAQTVAWPALTRFTSGDNVFAAAEIYTSIGATGTTATISYTNTTPTAGRASPAIVFGGSGFSAGRTVLPFGMQQGDTGVTACASVTVLATTGTAGNFGVTAYRALGLVPWTTGIALALGGVAAQAYFPMPPIPDNACLQLMTWGLGNITSVGAYGEFAFFED